MQGNFPACLAIILTNEGGWSDNPADPGGQTNLGITLATLQSVQRGATADDLRALTPEEAGTIYQANYWSPTRCDDLPAGVDLCVFDAAVNMGVRHASMLLQEAVGSAPDGAIGPATMNALSARSPASVIGAMSEAREAYYRTLGTFDTFGRGWLNRVASVRASALAMVIT